MTVTPAGILPRGLEVPAWREPPAVARRLDDPLGVGREACALLGADRRGIPVAVSRVLPVCRRPVALDVTQCPTHRRRDDVVVVYSPRGAWLLSDPEACGLSAVDGPACDAGGAVAHVPVPFWRDDAVGAVSRWETAVLLRSVLEGCGAFRGRAVLYPRVRVASRGCAGDRGAVERQGMFVEHVPEVGWVPLFRQVPVFDRSRSVVVPGAIDFTLGPVAQQLRRNLWTLTARVRCLGVAVADWSDAWVHRSTGRVALAEAAPLVLIHAPALTRGLARATSRGEPLGLGADRVRALAAEGHPPFMPFPAAVATGDEQLLLAERQLFDAFRTLDFWTGVPADPRAVLPLVLDEFRLFIDSTGDAPLIRRLETDGGIVDAMIARHIDLLGWHGLLGFITTIIPAVLKLYGRPGEWFAAADALIVAAHAARAPDLEKHWGETGRPMWARVQAGQAQNGTRHRSTALPDLPPGAAEPGDRGPVGQA